MNTPDPLAFRRGDPGAFRQAVLSYSPRLLGMLRSYVDPDDADDLLQTTWVKALRHRSTFNGGSLLGWLLAIARRSALDHVRADRTTEPLERLDPADHTQPSADHRLERAEASKAMFDALLTLGDRQRDVVVLRLLEGRSVRETADHLSCAEGTVKATLHQSVKRLKAILGDCP